jgi:hypothetical protein
MDKDKCPIVVRNALIDKFDGDVCATDKHISECDARDLFSEYCNWEGLIGYGQSLWVIVQEMT